MWGLSLLVHIALVALAAALVVPNNEASSSNRFGFVRDVVRMGESMGQEAVPDVVKLPAGALQGLRNDKSRTFKGIPYAEPPLSDLRWRPPQQKQPWSGVWDATDFRSSCLQGPFDPPITNTSEDCLFLNVYAPLPPPPGNDTLYPVMIWLHGGSYAHGSGNESRLNGTWNAEYFENIIIVTVNYRLNVFGYLASDLLRSRSPDNSTGNYGLQDQRFAMQWVSENIKYFAGDRTRVTIFGESAGAGSVATHLTTPKSWPFFSRAIMESGAFALWDAQDFKSGENTFATMMELVHCSTVDCLLRVDGPTLTSASNNIAPRLGGMGLMFNKLKAMISLTCKEQIPWSPTVDGVELLDFPWALARDGKHANVPTILGTNLDEGSAFTNLPKKANAVEYNAFLLATYGQQYVAQLHQLYPPAQYQNSSCCSQYFYAAEHIVGDFSFTCPTRRGARWFARTQPETYLYYFTRVPTGQDFAFHSCEIPFVYQAQNLLLSQEDKAIAQNMATLWVQFAHGVSPPHVPGTPAWPLYSAGADQHLVIDQTLSVGRHLHQAQCDFWDPIQLSRRCD